MEKKNQGQLLSACQKGTLPPPMPDTKRAAFHEEFPFVKKHVKGPIWRVYVSRIDPEVVERVLERRDVGMLTPEYNEEYAYLVDDQGEIVCSSGKHMVWESPYCIIDPRRLWAPKVQVEKEYHIEGIVDAGESIASVLLMLKDEASKVKMVISYHESTRAVILYKMPKGLSLSEWITCQIAAAKKQFRRTTDEIESDPVSFA